MNKKNIIIIVVILISFVLIGGIIGVLIANHSGEDTTGSLFNTLKKDEVAITENETKNIEYTNYDNGSISMQIPKGWTVEIAPFDNMHYCFTAYNPENTDYKIFFMMKSEGYLKTQEMKDWYTRNTFASNAEPFGGDPMRELPVIDPQTTEQFYKILTEAFEAKTSKPGNFTYPRISNFQKIDSIGKNELGGEIIRATYTNENGRTVDGIFTTVMQDYPLYYITAVNVYNIIFYHAPQNELTEWESVLNHCVSTIQLSQSFVSALQNQEQILSQTIRANAAVYSQITDIITSGWEARQSTYDIISQKQSDATMGYERVYDTDTGDIYKADLGFSDHDWNGKYEPITDSMYNLPTSGYIEKVD